MVIVMAIDILTDYVYDANEFLMTHGDNKYFVIFKTLKFNPWGIISTK